MEWVQYNILQILEIIALCSLVVITLWQLRAFREDAKIRNTLDALTKYSLDPTLTESKRYLTNKVTKDSKLDWTKLEGTPEERVYASHILNYLEVIAHGYKRNYFDRETVEKEFKKPIQIWGDIFLGDNKATSLYEKELDSFPNLLPCYKEWAGEKPEKP